MTLLLNAYYITGLQTVRSYIWIWRSEYINVLLSLWAAFEISGLTDNIVSLAN